LDLFDLHLAFFCSMCLHITKSASLPSASLTVHHLLKTEDLCIFCTHAASNA
jgi:hypothetical protein